MEEGMNKSEETLGERWIRKFTPALENVQARHDQLRVDVSHWLYLEIYFFRFLRTLHTLPHAFTELKDTVGR